MYYTLVIAILIGVDQLVKFLVRTNIPLGTSMPFIPYLMDLSYVQNTGAAFSMLSDHTWLLSLVSAVVSLGIAVALFKGIIVKHPIGKWSLAVVLAGAVGNLIDRVWLGYVVDMFKTTFIDFAVFNVADICVVCGGIVLMVYILFFAEKLEPKEEHHDDNTATG